MDEKKEIRFIEMFCGVGGFRLGLERADYSGGFLQSQEAPTKQARTRTKKREEGAKGG